MTNDTLTLRPIGIITTPFRTLEDCPRNGRQPDPPPPCRVRMFPEFVPGLHSLDGFSHLILLYWLHQGQAPKLMLAPKFDRAERGVFSTRSPARPNPIGLSVVAFDGMAGPDTLLVRYLDCLDGTPLLDVKPYLPSTDAEPAAAMGWLERHRTR
ncbi:MAG: tRNA (N6-threonylcarbamoyladenosine(37)-N6)-methyltransferase TrmO [Acetobacteraceae bacterium]